MASEAPKIDGCLHMMGIFPWLRAIAAQVGFVTESQAANTLIAIRTEAINQVLLLKTGMLI